KATDGHQGSCARELNQRVIPPKTVQHRAGNGEAHQEMARREPWRMEVDQLHDGANEATDNEGPEVDHPMASFPIFSGRSAGFQDDGVADPGARIPLLPRGG